MAAHRGATIGRAILCTVLAALAGCASNPPAPVEDRSLGDATAPAPQPEPESADAPGYRVVRGDTLYGIAFKNGLDYRDLARWNRIAAPYTIYVGQRLRLDGAAAPEAIVAAAPPPSAAPADLSEPSLAEEIAAEERRRAGDTPPVARPLAAVESPKPRADTAVPPPAPAGDTVAAKVEPLPKGALAAAAKAPSPVAPPPPVAPVPRAPDGASKAPLAAPGASLSVGGVAWRWPAAGKVVGSFAAGDPTRGGIDIAGKAGDPVYAAADGTVVYSGNGLIGYGELIIVKHNASFLSAYGHNRKRLVKEGETVKAGQAIAEMGASAATRDALHFEIRKNGKPANPLDFLPAQ